jgi:hypothetical protein
VRVFTAEEIDEIKRGLGQTKDLTRPAATMLPEILRLRQQGLSLSEIGRRLGFTHQSIGRAVEMANTRSKPTDRAGLEN